MVRDAVLQNRTNRLKLADRCYHWRTISKGLSIGYRRGGGTGTWYVRTIKNGKRTLRALGKADDFQEADGAEILNFGQAQNAARDMAHELATRRTLYTVNDALNHYLEWFKAERRSYDKTKGTVDRLIRPKLGKYQLAELTPDIIRRWRDGLVRPSDKPDRLRARRATANRVLTVLKAALNHAWRNDKVESDGAWRRVGPYQRVDAPKIRYLSVDESQRLVNACEPDFRLLVQAALYCGARYGELIAASVKDYHPDAKILMLTHTKNGKPRAVPLTVEGDAFFSRVAAGKEPGSRLFTRENGEHWKASDQVRRMAAACERAGLEKVRFHDLRHSYGSALAMAGVPLQVIAHVLGHSDTRITERHYAHLSPSFVADAVRGSLPDLGAHKGDNVIPIKRE
ncbi:tyrosine-type recombinase/integrase [Acidihalobacter aeolianus]|nr:site-specific integrase [Acidihalobacter aeolianus]